MEASENLNICARVRNATKMAIEDGISFLKVTFREKYYSNFV